MPCLAKVGISTHTDRQLNGIFHLADQNGRSSFLLFWSWYTNAREDTISVTVTPAPSSAQTVRNAQSVTPAIGARNTGLLTSIFPIFMVNSLSVP